MNNKPGLGRPTKYKSNTPAQVRKYTQKCLKNDEFPTIAGLAIKLRVGTRTLYDWEKIHPDFSQTMEALRDTQKHLLITNGITGIYNTRFSMFLLRANHGIREKEPLITSTQNNNMNISPELLADALKLMRDQET